MNHNQTIAGLIRGAVDLHIHTGPEIIPRKYTIDTLVEAEAGLISGVGVKNHFFPTVAVKPKSALPASPFVVGSVALNRYVGGLNPAAVEATAALSKRPIIVWMPTISAKNHLDKIGHEIAPEWVAEDKRSRIPNSPGSKTTGISVMENNRLTEAANSVLQSIKDNDAILATGHLSYPETELLVTAACQIYGIKRIIITHPIYGPIDMPADAQKRLASLGAYMEHSFSMYAIDKIPIARIIEQVRAVGPDHCILTSDVGQTFSPPPSVALAQFCRHLLQGGIDFDELRTMLVKNPGRLVRRHPAYE